MTQINLAPGTQYIAYARRRRRLLYSTAALICLVLLVVWIVVARLQASSEQRHDTLTTSLQSVEGDIARAAEAVRRIEQFENRLAAMEVLLANHTTWTPVLGELERLLPVGTAIEQLVIERETGELKLTGVTPNFDEVAQTFASFMSSANRPTLFADGNISLIERVIIQTTETVTGSTSYRFVMSVSLGAGEVPALQ